MEVSSTSRQAEQLRTIIWLPRFLSPPRTTYKFFTVVLRLSCPFIRLTNLSKASRTIPLMSETLTGETVHVKAQLSPVNHCQNDKEACWGQRTTEREMETSIQILLTHQLSNTSAVQRTFVSAPWMPCSLWMYFMGNFNNSKFFLMFWQSRQKLTNQPQIFIKKPSTVNQLKINACLLKSENQNKI